MDTFHDHCFARALRTQELDLRLLVVDMLLFDLVDQLIGHLTLELRRQIQRRGRGAAMMETSLEISHSMLVVLGEVRMPMEEPAELGKNGRRRRLAHRGRGELLGRGNRFLLAQPSSRMELRWLVDGQGARGVRMATAAARQRQTGVMKVMENRDERAMLANGIAHGQRQLREIVLRRSLLQNSSGVLEGRRPSEKTMFTRRAIGQVALALLRRAQLRFADGVLLDRMSKTIEQRVSRRGRWVGLVMFFFQVENGCRGQRFSWIGLFRFVFFRENITVRMTFEVREDVVEGVQMTAGRTGRARRGRDGVAARRISRCRTRLDRLGTVPIEIIEGVHRFRMRVNEIFQHASATSPQD